MPKLTIIDEFGIDNQDLQLLADILYERLKDDNVGVLCAGLALIVFKDKCAISLGVVSHKVHAKFIVDDGILKKSGQDILVDLHDPDSIDTLISKIRGLNVNR